MIVQHSGRPRLQLFGPVRLVAAGGDDVTPRGQKVLGLLALLALARGGRLARVAAATRLWSSSHDAKANLRQCLRELRRTLDAAGSGLLRTDDHKLVLDRDRLVVDALVLDRADAVALGAFDDDCLLRDIEIADPLFDEWLAAERLRWRDQLHHRLEAVARARLAADDPAASIKLATRLLGFEPTLEAAHRILMQGHAARGNASLALRQFELCRDILARELGVAPSAPTLALRAAIARPPARATMAGVAILAGALVADRSLPRPAPLRVGLAAFRVLSEAAADALHAEIVAEAIGAALAGSTGLAVIDTTVPPPGAVAYIVDGSVARLDQALRLTVRLYGRRDRRLLWAEHFRIETPCKADALDSLATLIAARLELAALRHEGEAMAGAADLRCGGERREGAGRLADDAADVPAMAGASFAAAPEPAG